MFPAHKTHDTSIPNRKNNAHSSATQNEKKLIENNEKNAWRFIVAPPNEGYLKTSKHQIDSQTTAQDDTYQLKIPTYASKRTKHRTHPYIHRQSSSQTNTYGTQVHYIPCKTTTQHSYVQSKETTKHGATRRENIETTKQLTHDNNPNGNYHLKIRTKAPFVVPIKIYQRLPSPTHIPHKIAVNPGCMT